MVKNYKYEIRVSNKEFKNMINEIRKRVGANSIEDTLVKVFRFVFPDIVIKYYPFRLKPITVGGENSGGKSKK